MLFIGIAICVYFSYHAIYGSRSFSRWLDLNTQITTMSKMNNNLDHKYEALEKKVTMMRPESLNKDMLEERVRLVLGYAHPDEIIVVRN